MKGCDVKVSIRLDDYRGYSWGKRDGRFSIGTLSSEEIDRLSNVLSQGSTNFDAGSLSRAIADIKGFYSLVFDGEDFIVLVVDHLGSFPVFYSIDRRAGEIKVSDRPENCLCGNSPLDPDALIQFKFCFTTMKDKTLWMDVHEVESGSFVLINKATGHTEIHKYYNLIRAFSQRSASNEDIDRLAEDVFGRVKTKYGNQQIVLPVTAGIDSRTIAVLLKEMGLDNVFTFSVGPSGSDDVAIGRQVAHKLGYAWMQIELTGEDWRRYFSSEEHRGLVNYSLRGGRINHALMGHALYKLKETGVIQDGAVFMPGHSGCIMGGEMKKMPEFPFPISRKLAVRTVCELESRIGCARGVDRKMLESEYAKRIVDGNRFGYRECCALYDTIHMQDYILKFIINDVRNYEFYGYKWYLPIMDKDWCTFWTKRTFEEGMGKKLIADYINTRAEKYDLEFPVHVPTSRTMGARLIPFPHIKNGLLRAMQFTNAKSRERVRDGYFDWMTSDEYAQLVTEYRNAKELINAFLATEAINQIGE